MYLIYVNNQVYGSSSNYNSAVEKASKYSLEKPMNNTKIWTVAVYIRLSQEDTDNREGKLESNSVTSQKTIINEFVKENK